MREINPDIIFLTGDYVKWGGDYGPALSFLSQLKAGDGVWAIMGDYDYSSSQKSCLFCHEKGSGRPNLDLGVKFLRNSGGSIEAQKGSVRIIGIDPGDEDKKPFPIKSPAIVLIHDPLFFDTIDDKEDVLVLAGDTHGGQIPLPSWLWRLIGYEKNARYSQGLFQNGRKKMYVSRGIGTSHLPLRLFRRPEIVVLHF